LELLNKTILITGASSGIGKACAQKAAEKGASVVLLARDFNRLEETRYELVNPEKHVSIATDLFNEGFELALEQKLTQLERTFHGFVHAAGISPTSPAKLIKHQQIQDCFQLNVFSSLVLTQMLLKPKFKNGNSFSAVYISSVVSEVGEKGKTLYAMSKSAIVGMCKSLAIEYAAKGARFNCVSPAVVETRLSQKSLYRENENAMREVLEKHPLGLGEPEDIAYAVVYLLSDFSKWVTGTNMIVDGGYLAK